MNRAITISRKYGDGGREAGEKPTQRLGIPFYDKGLITTVAGEGNIETSVLRVDGEVNPDLDSYSPQQVLPDYQIAMTQRIHAAQATAVHSLNDKGPCVTVGRCVNTILPDAVNMFVFTDMEGRINCIMFLNLGSTREKTKTNILAVGKRRKAYDEHYFTIQRGGVNAYGIYLNSGPVGVEGCLEATLTYIKYVKQLFYDNM